MTKTFRITLSLPFGSSSKSIHTHSAPLSKSITVSQILVFVKFILQIYYPPPYPREIWHYKQANSELIRRAISKFNWDRAFLSTNVNEKVSILTSTVMNILTNFIPHETIVCDDKDPAWFNKAIKSLIQEKKDTFKKYRKSTITSSFHNA